VHERIAFTSLDYSPAFGVDGLTFSCKKWVRSFSSLENTCSRCRSLNLNL